MAYTEIANEEDKIISKGPTAGAIYLQGYAHGFYGHPRVIQRTKKAQETYIRGYDAGAQARTKAATTKPTS